MSQNLQNFTKSQKNQLDNRVDLEKCCRTHIYLQKSVPIQPKTSNILPKFCRSAGVPPPKQRREARAAGEERLVDEVHVDHDVAGLKLANFLNKNLRSEICIHTSSTRRDSMRSVEFSASCRSRRELSNEYLRKSASIQPRTSPSKFGGKLFTT